MNTTPTYANPANACSGCYGKCLDVKLTNDCNGHCAFCIEADGYSPMAAPVNDLINATNKLDDYQNILILGGEPFLYPFLYEYVRGIQGKENIYITTNGSCFANQPRRYDMYKMLTGVNISIHHYSASVNEQITGVRLDFEMLAAEVAEIRAAGVKVRINTNLVRGGIEAPMDVWQMVSFARFIDVDEIRFAELQGAPDLFVPATDAIQPPYPRLPDDPFTGGCEIILAESDDFKVIARQTCGIVNEARPPVPCPVQKGAQTKVLYANGEVSDGWRNNPHKAADAIANKYGGEPCHKSCR